jgi:hypothetical protein
MALLVLVIFVCMAGLIFQKRLIAFNNQAVSGAGGWTLIPGPVKSSRSVVMLSLYFVVQGDPSITGLANTIISLIPSS